MTTPQIPESRIYRHVKCDDLTIVAEHAFANVSNPMADVTRTWCNRCNSFFPMSDFAWADSNENITDYYARHSTKASNLDRLLCSKKCMIALAVTGLCLGLVGGYFLMRNENFMAQLFVIPTTGFIGLFIGCVIFIELLTKPITRKVCGVSDTPYARLSVDLSLNDSACRVKTRRAESTWTPFFAP